MAGVPAREIHRTGVSESVQRHRAEPVDCGEYLAGIAARPRARFGLGATREPPPSDAAGGVAPQYGPGTASGQCHRKPVGRPAAGAYAADGFVAETGAAAASDR